MAFNCCQKNVIESSISIEDAEDIVITENNDKPLSSTFELEFMDFCMQRQKKEDYTVYKKRKADLRNWLFMR